MPHFMTWDATYYDFHGASDVGHSASGHRRHEPINLEKAPSRDSFEFDLNSEATPGRDPVEPSLANADLFEPLQAQPEVALHDHSAGTEHEVEFDLTAGV